MPPRPAWAAAALRLAIGLASLLCATRPAWAHGERPAASAWIDGCAALFTDPPSLTAWLALALWLAQAGPPLPRPAWQGGLAGLVAGLLLAIGGLVLDLSLPLNLLTLVLGALLAWARPVPAGVQAAVAAAAAAGVLLMVAPASSAGLGFRLVWLAGALLCLVLVFGNAWGLVLALLGRKPGSVRRMLLRVLGAWLATAAVLAAVLQVSRGAG